MVRIMNGYETFVSLSTNRRKKVKSILKKWNKKKQSIPHPVKPKKKDEAENKRDEIKEETKRNVKNCNQHLQFFV